MSVLQSVLLHFVRNLSAKKPVMLDAQVDISCVRDINVKKTLSNKTISFHCFFTVVYRVLIAVVFSHVHPG